MQGYEYDDFGNKTVTGDAGFLNEVTFTGAVADSTGLYYMNSRFYNPNTGRFLTQDSYTGNAYEPWSQHLYSYTGNNPINYVDPTGHAPRWTNISRWQYRVDPADNNNFDNEHIHTREYGHKEEYITEKKKDNDDDDDIHHLQSGVRMPNSLRKLLSKDGIWSPRKIEINTLMDAWLVVNITGAAIATTVLILDDASDIGVADDALIPVTAAFIITNYNQLTTDISIKSRGQANNFQNNSRRTGHHGFG